MRVRISPFLPSRLVALTLAGLLCLIAVVPVLSQGSGDPAAVSSTAKKKPAKAHSKKPSGKKATASAKHGRASKRSVAKTGKKLRRHKRPRRHRGTLAQRRARTVRLKKAFVASTDLRPMAEQLMTMRTPAAYAGVTNFAHRHSGDSAGAAYLALGRAYQIDRRYPEAIAAYGEAKKHSEVLGDYADYLAAECLHASQQDAAAAALLRGFNTRYPDSIFEVESAELEANVLLAQGDAKAAQKALQTVAEDAEDMPHYELTSAEIAYALQQMDEAVRLFKHLLLSHPLTPDADTARARLTAIGAESSLTTAELRSLGDAYFNAGRYNAASEQYRALARNMTLAAADRTSFMVAAAACDLKLKRLTETQAKALPDSNDESGARRLYLLMELARNREDNAEQQQLVSELERRFPKSEWLSEALYSSGNMYLLLRDYPHAVEYYSELAKRFPQSRYAPAVHWRAGWLQYRQGQFADAAAMFDEQIRLYPNSTDNAAALYWRARLYEFNDHDAAKAAANYRTVIGRYQHYFYAMMARARLKAMGQPELVSQTRALGNVDTVPIPKLVDTFPADSPHLAKARLVANAGLNEYIGQEIAADPDSDSWSALAEAQIYASFGDTFRAMRFLKRALPYSASAPIDSIPLAYWRILFPEPWWSTIKEESAKNGLDPYLVASLIRQESEFNPSVISYANAYGLMQLLPSVGRSLARQEGISGFQTHQLLNPEVNIRLGTRYLKQMLDHFDGVQEYALAAYNAGDSRVTDWQSAGPYRGLDEFVESIPFSQTRNYVQAILRNEEIYRAIDRAQDAQARNGIALR